MAKIHAMLDIGKRSMMNSQTALQTVAHNIANKTTEGYSRQRVEQVTNPSITEGRLQLGMGARAASVTRTNNPFLDKQLQMETGVLGFHSAQSEAMARVEQVFNEQSNKGLNQYMTDFFNAYRELSNNPESNTSRVVVKEAADALAKDFKRVDNQLNRCQQEVDMEVKQTVGDINGITKEIADLNSKIASIEIQGNPANDERDRRDTLVKHLQEKIDVHIADGDNGMISVSTAGNAMLVSGFDQANLTTYPDPNESRIHVMFQQGNMQPFDITDRIHGGRLGGNLEIRDKLVPDLRDKISDIAVQLANDVNAAHVQGYDRAGRQCGRFFEFGSSAGNAAANIKLTDDVANDVTRIAAASHQNAPGDNTVANVISHLQHTNNMDGGTMDDFYAAQVGRVGVIANGANKAKESQEHVLEQVNNLRESVSGVSLDEEATKMIEYQKAFEASARVIRTADEMFDTVLNLKRL